MVITKRILLSSFLLVALMVLDYAREVGAAGSRLESFVDEELPFAHGLGIPSIKSFQGDFALHMMNGVDDVVQAWYMDDDIVRDQRLPHRGHPDDSVPLAKLLDLGIVAMRLDADNYENDENLTMIRGQRGYLHTDIVTLTPAKMANYEVLIKRFFEEHLHTDEEVRYCLEGSGYFDVRDENDRWVRVSVTKGGLIVVPAGIYHRFTLDTNNYIKAMRLFSGGPEWTAYNRPHDHLPARKKYLAALHKRREEQS